MKKFVVAAALLMSAVGAYASNFRGADQVYIPIAGHAEGRSGVFISDVYLSNLTGDTVSVSAIYQPINVATNPNDPSSIGQEFRNVIELAPFERKEYRDFFPNGLGIASGFGQIILNGCRKGSDCGPATQDSTGYSPFFRAISAESRIYQIPRNSNPATAPTTGQLFSGIPWYNFVSELQAPVNLDKVFITGITHTGTSGAGTYRTNFGFANASQYSSTQLLVTLYKGALNTASRVTEKTIDLTPLQNVQLDFPGMFPTAPLGGNYFVVVEQRGSVATPDAPTGCTKGCPAFLAYASVLDNQTGDATTLEPQYLVELSQGALDVIYPSSGGKVTFRRSARH